MRSQRDQNDDNNNQQRHRRGSKAYKDAFDNLPPLLKLDIVDGFGQFSSSSFHFVRISLTDVRFNSAFLSGRFVGCYKYLNRMTIITHQMKFVFEKIPGEKISYDSFNFFGDYLMSQFLQQFLHTC